MRSADSPSSGNHHNWAKGAAIFEAMLEALPRKRFYLKIDLDSIVLPRALLRLLHGFDRTVGSDGPLYFGNGAYMPPY